MLIDILLVPDNSREAEDLLRDRTNAVVRVAVGGTPVLGKTATSRVVNDLHSPTEFSHNLQVRHSGHVRMSPSMNGDIVC